MRGYWRSNVNFIFWPHCYDRHVVSFLISWYSTGAIGSTLLDAGFLYCILSASSLDPNSSGLQAPSVRWGLPYHISSLTLWGPLATASGVSEVPLGQVWPSLPHLVSNPLGVCWQLPWDPNSSELNNNSTPTRSPTGSLNRMFNRHQAEITVMQFRGYSLPVHDCNGTMKPSPCPIS